MFLVCLLIIYKPIYSSFLLIIYHDYSAVNSFSHFPFFSSLFWLFYTYFEHHFYAFSQSYFNLFCSGDMSFVTFHLSQQQKTKKQQVIFLPPQKHLIHLLKYDLKKPHKLNAHEAFLSFIHLYGLTFNIQVQSNHKYFLFSYIPR